MLRGEERTFDKAEAGKVKKTLKTAATGSKRRGVMDQQDNLQEKDKAMRTDVKNINCETNVFHQTQI